MTRIVELLGQGTTISFEFFPPKTDEGEQYLRQTLTELEPLRPSFVSVTYGAGGSTRERTHGIVVDILNQTSMTPMAHLTSVCHSREELRGILARYRDAGVDNILALRGDPPRDEPDAWLGELAYALDLVELVREVGGDQFSVGVAAHPEVHPLSPNRAEDRKHLASKLLAADFGITQFFFRTSDWVQMMDELADLDCDRPVVPGIMPVTNVGQIKRMAKLSGADVPAEIADQLHAVEADPAAVRQLGVELATELCQELLEAGAPGLHFYTLNRSTATLEIHEALNLG